MKKDEEEEKKRKRRKLLKKLLRKTKPRLGTTGSRGRAYRPKLKPRMKLNKPSRSIKPEVKPKKEKTYKHGKVEPWTEPQKPKIRKIVKHQVDTEKLFKDLEKENEETLNKLAERIEEGINDIQQQKIEAEEPEVGAEAKVESENVITSAQMADEEESGDEPLDSDESAIEEVKNEAEENTEDENNLVDEPDSSDFGSEILQLNPDFWQDIGNDLWSEFEQIEPEAEYAPPEEAAME